MSAAAIVEEEPPDVDEADSTIAEMELFLAEHQLETAVDPEEIFDERDVAEALAVSWKERRKEMVNLRRARKFTQAGDTKRSFKVEIEEMKRRTRCNRCGQVGHWARECSKPKGQGKGTKTSSSSAGRTSESGAALVEDFVAMVSPHCETCRSLEFLRNRKEGKTVTSEPVSSSTLSIEQLLVSSPGFGVLDSGRGRSIIGASTLREFEALWSDRGWTIPSPVPEVNHFKFGNGQKESTSQSISVPVLLGGRSGTIKAAIVQGNAPLLISRNALKTLRAVIDFAASELTLFDERITVPLCTNQAGQFTVDLMGQPDVSLKPFAEAMHLEPTNAPQDTADPASEDVPAESHVSNPDATTADLQARRT